MGCEDRFRREDEDEHTRQNSQKHLTLTASLAVDTKEQFQHKLEEQDKKHKEEENRLKEQIAEMKKKIEDQEKKMEDQEKKMIEEHGEEDGRTGENILSLSCRRLRRVINLNTLTCSTCLVWV